MDRTLIAAVEAPRKAPTRQPCVGSGYPIAPRLVLTARHVVEFAERDDASPLMLHFPDHPQLRSRPIRVEHQWCASDLDVALLATDEVIDPDRIPGRILSRSPQQNGTRWQSAGFPRVINATRRAYVPTSFTGELLEYVPGAKLMEVDVRVAPQPWPGKNIADSKHWRGMSGAPLFVSNRIVGMLVAEANGFSGHRLHAIPSTTLLAHQEFRERAGIAPEPVPQPSFDLSDLVSALTDKYPLYNHARRRAMDLGLPLPPPSIPKRGRSYWTQIVRRTSEEMPDMLDALWALIRK